MESVLAQTMEEFELLIVDNASTDATKEVIQSYAGQDGRIRPLFCETPGVSAARNAALQEMKGQFVMFLDADDWVDDDYFETFLAAMDGVELVSGGYRAYHEKEGPKGMAYDCFYESPGTEDAVCSAAQMLERLFLVRHYQGYVWNKCYRAESIRKQKLCFQEDISYNEDRLFTVEYLAKCGGKARMLGVNKYHYILRAGNAVSAASLEFPAEKEFTEIEAFSRMLFYLKKYPKALELARKNMAERELLLFSRMVDLHGFARYRKSERMRYHARHFSKLQYQPLDDEERLLCRKLIFYGWTGICYGKKK